METGSPSAMRFAVRPRKLLALQLLLVLAILAAACVPMSDTAGEVDADDNTESAQATSSTTPSRTTGVPTMQPTPAEDLGIALDPTGRPYDNDWGPLDDEAETRFVARLEMPEGRIEVVDGDTLYLPTIPDVRDTETVRFRTSSTLDLSIVWQRRTVDDGEPPTTDGRIDPVRWYPVDDAAAGDNGEDAAVFEAVLGVLLVDPEATVVRWGAMEPAYDSPRGIGAFTGRAVLNWANRNLDIGNPLVPEQLPVDEPFQLIEVDDVEGADVFLFDNGAGPGPAMLVEGFDEDDRLVALLLWDPRYPWRLAMTEGEPPADIVEREDELIDCIEGRRLVDRWGRCT